MTVVCTTAGIRRGAVASLPLFIGTLPFGLVCGIIGQLRGLSAAEITLMSTVVYAGSAQIVALGGWAHPAPVLGATLAALAVNIRFALMGPVLGPWLDHLRGWRLFVSLFTLADQNWALAVRELRRGGTDAGFLVGCGVMVWLSWVGSTVAGYAMAQVLHLPPGHPLFFAALAIFVATLTSMWRGRGDALPWAVAGGVAYLVHRLAPGSFWHIVVGALVGSIAGALAGKVAAMARARGLAWLRR